MLKVLKINSPTLEEVMKCPTARSATSAMAAVGFPIRTWTPAIRTVPITSTARSVTATASSTPDGHPSSAFTMQRTGLSIIVSQIHALNIP